MKLCVIGKYPPIEGGVSAQTYWIARGLARRGHEVHVVTNADEVEEAFRMKLEDDDWSWYEASFGDTGGSVHVYNAQPFSNSRMGHIPANNPFVSKLASIATDVVRRVGCDAILAYYYEPYAVAGWLASRWTGCPLLVKHAGSDLDRLFAVPDLATCYKEILRSAEAVITRPRLVSRFLGMGVSAERLWPDIPYSVPVDVFRPDAQALDVARLARELDPRLAATAGRKFEAGLPTIGFYGKIGVSKGTFDLIAALGTLAREGLAFNLLAMIGGAQTDWIAPALREAALLERTYVIPMLPNWKVPSFIRACTAVCFLERDFPVAIHGPIVPREVLSCGTCLVLSGEIADKQPYRHLLVSGRNLLIAEDPKDHAALAALLRSVVCDPDRARAVGSRGHEISRAVETGADPVVGWEQLFERAVRGRAAANAPTPAVHATHSSQAAMLEQTFPELVRFVRARFPAALDVLESQPEKGNSLSAAARICTAAGGEIRKRTANEESDKLAAALRYLHARVTIGQEPVDHCEPPFRANDCLNGQAVSRTSAWGLRPITGNAVRIEEFAWNVSTVFPPLSAAGQGATYDIETRLSEIACDPMLVLFHRSPNLATRELRIDDATRDLLQLCDGSRTTEDLVAELGTRFGVDGADLAASLERKILAALQRLYDAGVIVFGDCSPERGWSGGDRHPVELRHGSAERRSHVATARLGSVD